MTSYQKAIAIAPSAAYHNNLGNAYVKLKQYDDAVEQYRQAELLNADQSSLYQQNIAMALVEEAQSRPNDSALHLLQQALAAFSHVSAFETKNAESSIGKVSASCGSQPMDWAHTRMSPRNFRAT